MSGKITVRRTDDFKFDGSGSSPSWNKADWLDLPPCDKRTPGHRTRAKMLASAAGLYVLYDCDDRKLTCTALGDGGELYNEDVVELFLWPDKSRTLYFEYEISPLGSELVLLIPNRSGEFMGWGPWHYEGERRTRRATVVRGGAKEPGAAVTGWSAEVFIPYALLTGIAEPPQPGTVWHANFCRIDYDRGAAQLYSWSPGITNSFHAFEKFESVEFE